MCPLVITNDAVDAGLNKDDVITHSSVRWVPFKVLTHLNGTFDQEVQILRELGGETFVPEDMTDATASIVVDKADAIVITQDETDLGRLETPLGLFLDQIFDLVSRLFHKL